MFDGEQGSLALKSFINAAIVSLPAWQCPEVVSDEFDRWLYFFTHAAAVVESGEIPEPLQTDLFVHLIGRVRDLAV